MSPTCKEAPDVPSVVLDLDVNRLPEHFDAPDGYDSALVLLRVSGHPAGQAVIPLRDKMDVRAFRLRVLERADSAFWDAWLRDWLELGSSPQPTKLPSATVAICTRDRTEDLGRCLAALATMPDHGQEILVVDNAPSTEATRTLVQSFRGVRYVRESRAGLDVARNRALREAKGEIVAFTDDDAAVDRLWLRSLLRNFADPLVMAVTGLTMALELETQAQVDFQRYGGFIRGFRRKVFHAASHDPSLAWQAGAGVNMAVRRSVAQLVGLFDEALDAGTPTQAGGDSDMFRRILKAGYKIVYDPEALNWHRHRRSAAELERQLVGYEIAGFAIFTRAVLWERDLGAAVQAGRWLRREFRSLARALLRRPGAPQLSSVAPRLRGALRGPGLYLHSRRSVRAQ